MTGGSEENSIKMWVKDEDSSSEFRVLRKREGAAENLKSIKFYGENGLHLVGYTCNASSEIIDYSVIKEEISAKLSQKQDKKMAMKGLATERDVQLKEVLDVDFAENRARDWSNLLSAHKFSQRPCFWEIENKT